jgi:hypothetical protein
MIDKNDVLAERSLAELKTEVVRADFAPVALITTNHMDYAGIEPELLQCEPDDKLSEFWCNIGFIVSSWGKCGNILITSNIRSHRRHWEIYGDMFQMAPCVAQFYMTARRQQTLLSLLCMSGCPRLLVFI